MTNDSIAAMLTTIRNGNINYANSVKIPYSDLVKNIISVLHKNRFISGYRIINSRDITKKAIIIYLLYNGKKRIINNLRRISKPGLKVYVANNKIPTVFSGLGIAILSTSKGILSNNEAKKQGVGGEVLAYIW